jgi:hypothetical protein
VRDQPVYAIEGQAWSRVKEFTRIHRKLQARSRTDLTRLLTAADPID